MVLSYRSLLHTVLCVVCASVPLGTPVSIPIRLYVDNTFVERAGGIESTARAVSDIFRKVNRYYREHLNIKFHIDGKINLPSDSDAPLLTRTCGSKDVEPRESFDRFLAYARKMNVPKGVIVSLFSGCDVHGGMATHPSISVCSPKTPVNIVGWRPNLPFDWFLAVHEFGHNLAMHDYLDGEEYIPGYIMGYVFDCCDDEFCSCALTADDKQRACHMQRNSHSKCMHASDSMCG